MVHCLPIAFAFEKCFEKGASEKEKTFRPTCDQRNRIWKAWRELFDAISPPDMTEDEHARVVEAEVTFGILVCMHVYMTKVTVNLEDIRRGKWLGQALLVMYRVTINGFGLKEFAATTEMWWLMEEDFETLRVRTRALAHSYEHRPSLRPPADIADACPRPADHGRDAGA